MSQGSPSEREQARHQLLAGVQQAPWAYDFFAVMRELERCSTGPRWGQALRPRDEPLRLGQDAELEFPVASLAGLHTGGAVPRLKVLFFGLLGPQGPMPLHFTEHVRERERQHADPATARFLDIFHHRLLVLFYRAWAQSQPVVQRDRPAEDRYAVWLGAHAGLDARPAALGAQPAPSHAVPLEACLHQAGLLSRRSRHAEGLEKVLGEFFGVGARVTGHVGHWLMLDADQRSRLPALGARRGQREGSARLGADVVIGRKVWDRQSKFRIRLGPLSLSQYRSFFPGQPAWRQMREWVHRYVGRDLAWDVELQLAADQVPRAALGGDMQLGLSTWLGERCRGSPMHHRSDLRLGHQRRALREQPIKPTPHPHPLEGSPWPTSPAPHSSAS